MRQRVLSALLCCHLLAPAASHASLLLASPSPPAREATLSIDYSVDEARYLVPKDRFVIRRAVVSSTWSYDSFFAGLGFVRDTDFDDLNGGDLAEPDGRPGYVLAAGARGPVWRRGDLSVNLHGQVHVISERLAFGGVNYKLQSREVLAGATAAWAAGGFRLYAGAEVMPHSDVDMGLKALERMEREDFLFLRAGGGAAVGPLLLDADLRLLGGWGLRLGVGVAF